MNGLLLLIIIFFLLLEWFYNHPALRYGGYPVICLFLFLPISNFLGSRIHVKNLRIKTYVVVLLGFIIFFSRNIDRIIDEKDKYDFNVFQDISYLIEDKYFTFDKEIKRILNNKINCDLKKEDCSTDIKIDVKINNGYYIFYRKSL